jgi:hypothetical protein
MRRGFKAWAEGETLRLRKTLGLREFDCLPARGLATNLGIMIYEPSTVPGMTPQLVHALQKPRSGFSAVTLPAVEPVIIIHNGSHAPTRQESNLMHEIAHVLCEHKCNSVNFSNGLPCRAYDPAQEEEAEWLGACLQIPRDGLLWCLRKGWDTATIAVHFGASTALARFRRNKTGVDAQLARARANPHWRR